MLISLCVVGLTAAAPQLFAALEPRALDQEIIVTDVVTALQPSIAEAVANALRSLQVARPALPAAPAFDAERAQFEAEFAGRNAEQAAAGGRAEYAFNYQVRDDEEGTYIYQQEARDGDDVTGSYGYIDPTGALVKVVYQAGADGFSQTLEQEKDFLTKSAGSSGSSSSGSSRGSSRGSSSSSGSSSRATSSSANSRGSTTRVAAVSAAPAAAFDQNALIAQILAALQPQITASVNSALAVL